MKEQVMEMADKIQRGESIDLPPGLTIHDVRRVTAHEAYALSMAKIAIEEKLEAIVRQPLETTPIRSVSKKRITDHLNSLSQRC